MRRALFVATILFLVGVPGAHAAPPELKSILPSGCRVGDSVGVKLIGKDLKGAKQLIFSQPGLTAQRTGEAEFQIVASDSLEAGLCDIWVVTDEGMAGPHPFALDADPTQLESEPNDLRSQAQSLPIPSVTDARLDKAADLDWYSFQGESGEQVSIRCRSAALAGSVEPSLRLVGPDGNELLHSEEYRIEPSLLLELPQSGTYWLRVCDQAYRKDDYSFYRLHLAHTDPSKSRSPAASVGKDSPATAHPIVMGNRVHGAFLERDAIDWYSFAAQKGKSYAIESFGERLGQRMDLELAIHSADGKFLTTLVDIAQPKNVPGKLPLASLDAAGTWKAPDDGTYCVAVRDLYGGSIYGPDRHYELVIQEEQPSFEVFAFHPQDDKVRQGLWLKQGSRTDLQVIAVREGGFSGPIKILSDQGPDGLTIEPASLESKKNSQDLQLTAAKDATIGFGMLHLVAEAEVGDQTVRKPVRPRSLSTTDTLQVDPKLDGIAVYVSPAE